MEIEDLGSANGTSVNGVAISGSQRLQDGDVVQVGRVRLTADVAAARRAVTVLARAPGGAHLVVTRGPLAGRRYAVGTELIVGRQGADLLIDDPQVSRRHAVVRASRRPATGRGSWLGQRHVHQWRSRRSPAASVRRATRSGSARSCSRRGPTTRRDPAAATVVAAA